jgi:hypothetical protein
LLRRNKVAKKPKIKSILDILKIDEKDDDFEIDDLNLIGINAPKPKVNRRKRNKNFRSKMTIVDVVMDAKIKKRQKYIQAKGKLRLKIAGNKDENSGSQTDSP